MKKPLRNNFILMLIVFVSFVMLNGLSPSIPINTRAIVVGLALDVEDGEYLLSAQIIQSGSSGDTAKPGSSTYAILKGRGKSLSTAIYDVTATSGYFMSLAHCSVVIMGESMRKEDCFKPLSYLVKNTKLADDTVVVFAEGTGEELLELEVGLSQLSAFGLKKLESANSDYSVAIDCTLREFMVDDKAVTGAKVVPLCRPGEKIEEPSSGGGENSGGGDKYEFDLNEGLVIGKGEVILLNEFDAFCYNLVAKDFRLGNTAIMDGEEITDLAFSKKDVKKEVHVSEDKTEYYVEVNITFLAFSEGREVGEELSFSESATLELEESYAQGIRSVFEKTREKGLDVFNVYEEYYRGSGKSAPADEFMRSLKITTKVNINFNGE